MARAKLKAPWSARKARPNTEAIDPDEGVFDLLMTRHRALAQQETRTIFFFEEEKGVPPGEYAFAEAFCAGKSCDCRRVMFMVYRRALDQQGEVEHVATIGFGWEPLSFYVKWMHGDREGAEFMRGPIIDPSSPRSGYERRLLEVFREASLSSPEYVDRVRRHYEAFKRG
jgi:hypothetical protein